MLNPAEMSDYELAQWLEEWMGDAANSWDSFSDSEKAHFRRMEHEACRRFVDEHMDE